MSGNAKITPAVYPELKRICWNRNPDDPIDRVIAFHLYERNWRFVDVEALTDSERQLITELGDEFGAGFPLFECQRNRRP